MKKVLIDVPDGNYDALMRMKTANCVLGAYHNMIIQGKSLNAMTNGEVIKTLFPDDTFVEINQNNQQYVEHHSGMYHYQNYNLDWWNAPYRG